MNRDDTTLTATASVGGDVGELRRVLADDAAFEAWYRRTVPRVFSYLVSRSGNADLAEELCQETYLVRP